MAIPDPVPLPAFNNPPEQPRPDSELLRRQMPRIGLAAVGVGIVCATCMPVLAAILLAAAVGAGGLKWGKRALHNIEGKNVDAKNLLVEAVSVCMRENDSAKLAAVLEHALERGVDPVLVGEQYRRCCEYMTETGTVPAEELAAFTKRIDAAIEKAVANPSISASRALQPEAIKGILAAQHPALVAAQAHGTEAAAPDPAAAAQATSAVDAPTGAPVQGLSLEGAPAAPASPGAVPSAAARAAGDASPGLPSGLPIGSGNSPHDSQAPQRLVSASGAVGAASLPPPAAPAAYAGGSALLAVRGMQPRG